MSIGLVYISSGSSYTVRGRNLFLFCAPSGVSFKSGIYVCDNGEITTIKAIESNIGVSYDATERGIKLTNNSASSCDMRLFAVNLKN